LIVEIELLNFKCFGSQKIPLRPVTIVVGKNNAGKSTIVEALRLVSLVVNRFENLSFNDVPNWLDAPRVQVGVKPSLDHQDFNFAGLFHRYGNPPSIIIAHFSSGAKIRIYLGGEDRIHAVIYDARGWVVTSKGSARRLGFATVATLPQISPVAAEEHILEPRYVHRAMSSTLASLHFRNQINLLYDESFQDFKTMAESTWHGLRVEELTGKGRNVGSELGLLIRNDDFAAELGWMGHGLQMWLQTMWFLARSSEAETVILDEPDVYMHADLQRRLIRLVRTKHAQVIVATHSIEIMAEVNPEDILIVDRDRREASFAIDLPGVQRVVDQIGGVHNVQLARLWNSRRCIFVEGDDLAILKQLQNTLFPSSPEPIDAVPNVSVGGWSGWPYAVGSSMLMGANVGQEMLSYCLFDSDFHIPQQLEERYEDAKKRGINLHIWRKKEIENYLLVPSAVHRIVRSRCTGTIKAPVIQDIEGKMLQIAEEMKDSIIDRYAEEFHLANRSWSVSTANAKARDLVAQNWTTAREIVSVVPGKQFLSRLSEWTQREFNTSLSSNRLARELLSTEIDGEMKAVLTAIEDHSQF
jgi:predicted ATPase